MKEQYFVLSFRTAEVRNEKLRLNMNKKRPAGNSDEERGASKDSADASSASGCR